MVKKGYDTLKLSLESSFKGMDNGKVTNIENVIITNSSDIGRTFSTKGFEGVESYTLNNAVPITSLTDLEKSVDITFIHTGEAGD